MPKEYRTIEEVAGPLMLVRGVQNVAYDELGEIELANAKYWKSTAETHWSSCLNLPPASIWNPVKSVFWDVPWNSASRKTC